MRIIDIFIPHKTKVALAKADPSPGEMTRFVRSRHPADRGFTLIELLVVIAIIAILAAMLLPALAAAKFRAQVVNCTSNMKEWGQMANMYANDFGGYLPGATMPAIGGAGNPWDIGTNYIAGCANYGLTVAMWFDPARPLETQTENQIAQSASSPGIGHSINSIADLEQFLGSFFGANGFVVLNYPLWTKRYINALTSVPNPNDTVPKTVPYVWGWPQKTTDKCCGYVPFMSDPCFAGYGSTVGTSLSDVNVTAANNSPINKLNKYSGHVTGGVLQNMNVVFTDGHVELHNRNQIQCYYLVSGNADWFY